MIYKGLASEPIQIVRAVVYLRNKQRFPKRFMPFIKGIEHFRESWSHATQSHSLFARDKIIEVIDIQFQ